jgi:hypothetical protein
LLDDIWVSETSSAALFLALLLTLGVLKVDRGGSVSTEATTFGWGRARGGLVSEEAEAFGWNFKIS